MEVNIHHAKTNLSRLILKAEAGEEVIIARAGKPAVKLVPVHKRPHKLLKPGALKGRLQVPANFLDADPAMEKLFYESLLVFVEPGGAAAKDLKHGDARKGRKRKKP
jgi:prevent-host-death family protein